MDADRLHHPGVVDVTKLATPRYGSSGSRPKTADEVPDHRLFVSDLRDAGAWRPGCTDGRSEMAQETSIRPHEALNDARLHQDLREQMEEVRRTQEQLFQTAKLAAVGEMAASIAHDLNSPLMVILGLSGLLERELPAGSRAAEKVATIATEAARAGKIVRDVIDLARRREPNRDLVALDQLVDRALTLFEGRLHRTRVEVARVSVGGPPRLPGDRDQLTEVFINLIGNAIDAMPAGGLLTIETGLHEGANGHRCAGVDVADTGHGIPPERLPHVFKPFYTTKPEGSGTGLGLPISRRIVEAHGGTLAAESTPGRGTRMRVRLPIQERG